MVRNKAEPHQVWRYITMSTVLTQEEIPEEGGILKKEKKLM